MSNERALDDHLGYLAYHIEALARSEDDREAELANIRDDADSQDERIKAERNALKAYFDDVSDRLVKLDKQVENCFEDAPETTRERATDIRESAISSHLDEADVPDTDFQTGSEIGG